MAKRQKPIEIQTEEEVELLMAQASRRGPTGIRNRALIAVIYYGSLRVGEAIALAPRDVDLARGEINVRRGKGAKQRLAVLSEPGIAPLQLWLATRAELGISTRAPLFCTISEGRNALAKDGKMSAGSALSQPYIWTMLKRLAERAGIEKRVHPHGLRHSHAVRLNRRGVPTSDIQGQLGHSSLATTSLYLDSVSPVDRASVIRAAG
jgi:site-specific recombinase XerD